MKFSIVLLILVIGSGAANYAAFQALSAQRGRIEILEDRSVSSVQRFEEISKTQVGFDRDRKALSKETGELLGIVRELASGEADRVAVKAAEEKLALMADDREFNDHLDYLNSIGAPDEARRLKELRASVHAGFNGIKR